LSSIKLQKNHDNLSKKTPMLGFTVFFAHENYASQPNNFSNRDGFSPWEIVYLNNIELIIFISGVLLMLTKKTLYAILIATLFLILHSPSFSQDKSDEVLCHELMQNYFDLILSGNYTSALDLWEPSALSRAERLAINYSDIPIKPDCGSPVIYDFARLQQFLYSNLTSPKKIDSGLVRVEIQFRLGDEKIVYSYLLKKKDEYFWIIFPQDYYAGDWPISESKYFRFHVNPKQDSFFNNIAVKSLDDYVERTAKKIIIPPERLALLAEKKIDYYFCRGEEEVQKISGRTTKGVYDLGADAIISSIFPHYHEVTHLLINFKLKELPLFTLPFIQEGTAVYFGGQWQRAPEVMLDFGEYILNYKIVELDSVLADKSDPNTVSADISYPVDACLMEYLFSTLGSDKFFGLYRSLSGDYNYFINSTQDSAKRILAAQTGKSWEQIKTDFEAFLKTQQSRGGLIFPGEITTGKEIVKDSGLVISSSDKWLKIEYYANKDDKADVNFLFGKDTAMAGKLSSIFIEQYKDTRPFEGYRFGIRLDRNEAGLYDYSTNQLMAKYVHDFDPGPNYYDSASGKYSAYFDINLLGKNLPKKMDYLIIK